MLHRPFLDKLFLVYGDGMQPRVHRHEQWLALFLLIVHGTNRVIY